MISCIKKIETKRLILRKIKLEDSEMMFKNWASSTNVTKFLTWKAHTSVQDSKDFIYYIHRMYEQPFNYLWVIELKSNQQVIGTIGSVKTYPQLNSLELGYVIGETYWHQGYTSEALTAVIDYLFNEAKVNRISCRHDINNPSSGKVMLKCGMQFEGILRQAAINNQGICDVACYSILADEYPKLTK